MAGHPPRSSVVSAHCGSMAAFPVVVTSSTRPNKGSSGNDRLKPRDLSDSRFTSAVAVSHSEWRTTPLCGISAEYDPVIPPAVF